MVGNVWLGDGAVIHYVGVELSVRFTRPSVRSICSHKGVVLLHDDSLLGRHVTSVKLLVVTLILLLNRFWRLRVGDNLLSVDGSGTLIRCGIVVLEALHIGH